MFLPNTSGAWRKKTGRNRHGESSFAEPRTIECAVVRLSRMAGKTSVRADSSASRGNASEMTMSEAKILFPATSPIAIDDRFTVAGYSLICISKEPRLSVTGILDHYECEFAAFVEEGA